MARLRPLDSALLPDQSERLYQIERAHAPSADSIKTLRDPIGRFGFPCEECLTTQRNGPGPGHR